MVYDPNHQVVVPMWESNVARADAEIEQIYADKEGLLLELKKRRNPSYEYDLLNVARIIPDQEGPVSP